MQARKLGEITRREALTGLSEADGLRLLETLKVLKFNLTEACDFGGKAEASKSWVVPAK
jgi:MarR family transcriptional regulator, transcriptional regulator for hemolysin